MRRNPSSDAGSPASGEAARAVLMVRPAAFARNEVTRPTNRFQSAAPGRDPALLVRTAQAEFDACAAALHARGIDLRIFPGRTTTTLPDEVFPNNWLTLHPDGTAVLYPLMAWNRRPERRRDILEQLQQRADGFRIERIIDLSPLESDGHFLEGTGSLVFDHRNRIAYACFSPRTHRAALREFSRQLGYDIVAFNAADAEGHAIYHTNVMLAIGERFALVCLDAIGSASDRVLLLKRLERSGREVIGFSLDQLGAFVGNVLQLGSGRRRLIAMSRRALGALTEAQHEALARHGDIVAVGLNTIEQYGGGSVRCMLAEILLPRKAPGTLGAAAE
jgi:hypothetical protein